MKNEILRAEAEELDLASISDQNLIRTHLDELRALRNSKKASLSSHVVRRLREIEVISYGNCRGKARLLTEKGLKAISEIEAEEKVNTDKDMRTELEARENHKRLYRRITNLNGGETVE
jgi:hypothetical protein